MKIVSAGRLVLFFSTLISSIALSADRAPDFSGRWEVTTGYAGGSWVAGLDLAADAGRYRGTSGYLVPDGVFYQYAGEIQKDGLHLSVLAPDGKTEIGHLLLNFRAGNLTGSGVLRDVAVTLSGRRPLQRPANAPRVIDFVPQVYYTTFSGLNPPALHIFPGDTVRTSTVDAGGGGRNAGQQTLPGNPQTGPFYVEGAMIGDTIAVHLHKIRPNRDTAFQYRATLDPRVLPPGYRQDPAAGWSAIWNLDRERGMAVPAEPSDKLKNLAVRITPMLGCIGVAPFWKQAIGTSDLGPFGGNLDYNEIREGTTVFLPVYQAGALLTIGDGHAMQADGEITGQGLETSMDVEFSVDLIPNQLLDQPWAESADSIMVSGIGGSLTDAFQNATAGLSNWLRTFYGLNSSEVATVLAAFVHYDIAEVVDPQAHVVARIGKDALSQIPKPATPSTVFCRPQWGCVPN